MRNDPLKRGGKRVDDRKVLRGIIPVIQKGRRWVDAPTTLYNRCRRWGDKGVFELIFSELSDPMPRSHPTPQSQRC